MSPEQQALAVFWSHKRFWLVQTLAIAAWVALAVAWFWLPDSRVWGIVLSALLGAVVVGGGLWLIGAALSFYQNPGPIWRRIPALVVWMAVFALAIWLSLRTKAPAWIWIVPAILLLQLALPMKSKGRARFLLDSALLAGAGAYLPYKLIGWHPQFSGLAMQTASLAVRFLLAFLLAVGAWLILASLIAINRRAQ